MSEYPLIDVEEVWKKVRGLKKFNPRKIYNEVNDFGLLCYEKEENYKKYNIIAVIDGEPYADKICVVLYNTDIVSCIAEGFLTIPEKMTSADYISDIAIKLILKFGKIKIVMKRGMCTDLATNILIDNGYRDHVFHTYRSIHNNQEIISYGIHESVANIHEGFSDLWDQYIRDWKDDDNFPNTIMQKYLSDELKRITNSKKKEDITIKDYLDSQIIRCHILAFIAINLIWY